MPAQVNARLLAVVGATAASGGRDDWDTPGVEPAGDGAAKWSGDVDAYYRERVTRVNGVAGETNVIQARTLIVATVDARAAGLDTDDVITFLDPAGVERTARVAVIAYAELAGVPDSVQTTRLELELA